MSTIETMKYGTNVHGKPFYSSRQTWRRVDTYPSSETGEVSRESHFAADPTDDSNLHPGSAYESNCSCCWLNFSHTVAEHEQSVRLSRQAAADHAARQGTH